MRSHYLVLLFSACVAASAHPGTLGVKSSGCWRTQPNPQWQTLLGCVCRNKPVPGRPHWQCHPLSPSCEFLSCSLRNDTHKPSPCEFHPERQQEENGYRWSTPSHSSQSSASSLIPEPAVTARKASHLPNWMTQQPPPNKKGLSKTPLKIYLQPSALKLPLLESQDWCCVENRPFRAVLLKSLNEQVCINKSPVWDWSVS